MLRPVWNVENDRSVTYSSRGFVARSVDPDDRRSRILVLTDKGRRARDAVVRAAAEQTPLGVLDDDELHQLLMLLHRAVPPD